MTDDAVTCNICMLDLKHVHRYPSPSSKFEARNSVQCICGIGAEPTCAVVRARLETTRRDFKFAPAAITTDWRPPQEGGPSLGRAGA